VRTVSASDSPLTTDDVPGVTVTVEPPRRAIAASNEHDVRVDGS